jgi:hypothetical protein
MNLCGKVDSRLVSKYKKWLESEKPDYFGGDRDLELRRNHSSGTVSMAFK